MKHAYVFACSTLLLISALGAAQAKLKQETKKPIVLGTQRMAGDFGDFGQTYTIGKNDPVNFTLKKVEYTVGRLVNTSLFVFPEAGEKLMLIYYTLHNPNPREQRTDWNSLKFTAVGADDVNYEYAQAIAREGTTEDVAIDLKPAQKIELVTAIKVPADAAIPKLIVQREEGAPVIRYNLKEKVEKLPAPFGDASGLKALLEVPGAKGEFYPMQTLDVRFEGGTYTKEALNGNELEEGKRYFTATVTLKNPTTAPQRYYWGSFEAGLIDGDGEKVEFVQDLLKASRNESAEGDLKAGEEYKVRFFFILPENTKAKKFWVKEGQSRTFVFDVPES